MLNFLKREVNKTSTANGAVTNKTTGSNCLDLFATIGALRGATDDEIVMRFLRAFMENKDLAMKILFYARDIRGGLGERRVFKIIYRWLGVNYPETAIKNLSNIAEYGRFDDILALMGTPCEMNALEYIKIQFENDMRNLRNDKDVSLLGKWLPSINASNKVTITYAKRIANYLGLSYSQYRKALAALRSRIRIIENNLRERDYTFDYSKQPSRAMFKYRSAFLRNDNERYKVFLNDVKEGKTTLNAKNVALYELVRPHLLWNWNSRLASIGEDEAEVINRTWESLPDYGNDENILPVIDTSGSMYGMNGYPASVALSLGIYFAERNKGEFAGHFIEFSNTPELIELKGENFVQKLQYVASFSKVANTNIEAVFDLILRTAVNNRLPQSELPSKLVLISDMEFDRCVDNSKMTNFEAAKRKFNRAGYILPEIVFWNVNSMNNQQPVTMNDRGVVLVSGVTPKLFEMVAGNNLDPYEFMCEVVESERYNSIVA